LQNRSCWPVVFLLLTLSLGPGTGREDPETSRLRVLFIGTAFWGTSPGRILLMDPKIDPTLVPIITVWYTDEENARYMRLYMPKNYGDLVDNQDLVHLAGCDAVMITPRWQTDMARAAKEGGLGVMMTDGHRGFGGSTAQKAEWQGSTIEQQVLPVLVYTDQFVDGPLKVRVLAENDPLMKSLPFARAPPLTRLNKLTAKEGASVLADDGAKGFPVVAHWEIGAGRSTIFATDLHGSYAPLWVNDWPYWHDFVLNLIYYACGADVPEDPEVMHAIRDAFFEYSTRIALLRDMIGFIEDFGANPSAIEDELSLIGEEKARADRLYLEQNYAATLGDMVQILERTSDVEKMAVRLKDRALQWVYMIEWLVVSGTSMAVGVVVWTLMISRRYYREIGTTRGR
jgi:uncharacterized membrane protein